MIFSNACQLILFAYFVVVNYVI